MFIGCWVICGIGGVFFLGFRSLTFLWGFFGGVACEGAGCILTGTR